MARKQTAKQGGDEAPLSIPRAGDSPTDAALRKKFGEGVIVPGSSIKDESAEVIPVSPRIDVALGGGLQVGTLATLTGPAGCGKTTVALQVAEHWQGLGRTVYYFATEWRLFPRDLENVEKLDASKLKVVRSHEDHIMTAEDFLTAADMLLRNEKNILLVMDSFSMIGDSDEMGGVDYKQGAPGKVSRMVGMFVKRMTPNLPLRKNLLIGTFHTYANIGGKTAFKGSVPSKVQFARSTGLYCSYSSTIRADKNDSKSKPIGQEVEWSVERSMLPGGLTGTKVVGFLRYGKGVDVNGELFEQGTALGLITGDGWYTLSYLGGDKPPKAQGREKTIALLDANPEYAEVLYAKIREILK